MCPNVGNKKNKRFKLLSIIIFIVKKAIKKKKFIIFSMRLRRFFYNKILIFVRIYYKLYEIQIIKSGTTLSVSFLFYIKKRVRTLSLTQNLSIHWPEKSFILNTRDIFFKPLN